MLLLSLGTGAVPKFIDSGAANGSLDWGLAQWARPLISIMIEGVMGVADFQCEQLLGERYRRVNSLLPRDLALDDVEHQADLIQWASDVPIQETVQWLRGVFLKEPGQVLVPAPVPAPSADIRPNA